MDAKEIVQCVLQMEKLSADGSYGNILTLLGDLDKSHITAEQLEATNITNVLHGLRRNCCDDGVKKMVESLTSKWTRLYGGDPREGKRTDAELPPGGGASSVADNNPHVPTCSDLSPVRSKCVQLLLAALSSQAPDGVRPVELAGRVERHIHECHRSSEVKYKACVRSKVANLRNPKNGHLHRGLLGGSLSPGAFARMSAEDMACAELRRLRDEYSSRGVSERQLPRGPEGTRTRKVRCRRCGGSDCSVTQVSRGALFLPAWVRRAGPDQDAMTFVTCGGCGQQWYHSGWVCL